MLGLKGYASVGGSNKTTLERLTILKENFKSRHWLSFIKGHKKEKIRVDVYLDDDLYYKLNVFCIKQGYSRGEFMRNAMLEKMNLINAERKIQKNQMKRGSLF